MTITLPPEFDQFVRDQVDQGKYAAPADVVASALQLLSEKERENQIDQLRRQVAAGIEEADRGELLDGEAVFDELTAMVGGPDDE